MNATTKTAIESAAADIIEVLIDDRVAGALAREIVSTHLDTFVTLDAIEAGANAAIEQIDGATFTFAVDVIRDRVAAELKGQATAIALRMLRETAAKAERAAVACSVEGGI